MKRSILYCIVLVVAGGCSIPNVNPDPTAVIRAPYDPTIAVKEVTWNEGRVKEDPKGAIGWSQLSSAYLNVARQTDDNTYAVKAEDAARKSLSIRRSNNTNAAVRLAKAILEQHRFSDSLASDEDALKINPNDPGAQELHAEILTELGRYDDAWSDYKKYSLDNTGLNGLSLKARLLEVDGKTDDAAILMKEAASEADHNWDMPREAAAWFHLKYGTVLWDEGKIDGAEQQFKIAIDTNPHDFKSMGSLARIEAAKGNLSEAKDWGRQSLAIIPSVEVASLMEDIASSENNSEDVAKYQTMVDEVSHPDMYKFLRDPSAMPTKMKPHTHDRLYAVYCADHKKNLPDALAAAKKDLAARQDIYAFDTIAWVLHQMGRDTEAKPWTVKAMSRGTQDAKMFFHAGMIDAGLGNNALARQELSRTMAINPLFQFGLDDQARDKLQKLGGAA